MCMLTYLSVHMCACVRTYARVRMCTYYVHVPP